MKFIPLMLVNLLLFQANLALAKDKLIATPINSPVKETYLKVKLEGFSTISGVDFKPKNGGTEVPGEVVKEGNIFIGKLKGSFFKPGKYEYRVKIRTASGKSQQNEAASVAFIHFEIDPSLEVADPGEEGMKTLLGVDADNSGVRDDLQRWVNENYPIDTSSDINKALKQILKYSSLASQNVDDSVKAKMYLKKTGDGVRCLDYQMRKGLTGVAALRKGSSINALLKKINSLEYNTKERMLAEFKTRQYIEGGPEETNPESKCEL